MIIVFIILSVIIIAAFLLFAFAFMLQSKVFGSRWQKDKDIDYYKPEDYEGLNIEKWAFSLDKETLKGEIYTYPNPSNGILVFAHGMWSGMISYTQEMEFFARCGYKVYGFNYEGTDTSTGKNVRGLANSLRCLDEAINYIRSANPNEKIFVCGHSWGAFAAINISGYRSDISAVCALAPFPSVKAAYNALLPSALKILTPFLLLIEKIKCGKYANADALKILENTTTPALIVHSKDDYLLKYAETTEILQKNIKNDRIEFLIVNKRGHNPDYTEDAVNYMKETSAKLKSLPKEKQAQYKRSLDYKRMGAVDENILSRISEFFIKNSTNAE